MFQNTIVKKYISTQNEDELISKWEKFKGYFHDSGNQNRIRELKEEQFQEGFLKELFVRIFGYIITPNENYNLIPELKNPKDKRKVDGGLIFNDVVKCVIELKGTNTTDLGKVEEQAFSYKNNQPGCKYVVTSNFEKLRFYIEDATEFLEFNLFELSQDDFNLMYLCLSSSNIENDLPKKIKSESLSQEDLITKNLYQDYSLFKRELFHNLIELNKGFDKLLLFKKSQKLLDRLLFLFFGEDKFLLPPNSVRLILDDWKDLIEKDVEIPLYDRFKKYFGYLNTGFKGKRYDVFPYNGGLFKPDEVLDNILIDDNLLYNHTKKLSEYDFESEVDVNILGHIFENSLSEIEEISNELISGEVNNSISKRKKDGVFYTPKYITKYIVDNTIGKLCDEKKNEFQIKDEDYITDKKRIKKTIKGLSDKLNEYRNWLLELTICDPSCGSGAFLNQSLDFLIKEHRYIDELQSKLFGDSLVLSDIENSILENNLFGVDINEESVEITKLSLWLRTAQPNRKLNSLSDNIKCGNSLIDEPIEGVENYFKWEEEFPKVFEKGGFDVVIGNPPYTYRNSISNGEKKYFELKFSSSEGNFELYKFFIEKGVQILKHNGMFSYITSSSFLIQNSFKLLRKFVLDNTSIDSLIPLGPNIFEGATVDTSIFVLRNNKNYNKIKVSIPKHGFELLHHDYYNIKQQRFINNYNYVFDCILTDDEFEIIHKLENNFNLIQDKFELGVGINTGYIRNELVSETKLNNLYHPLVTGTGISRYGDCFSDEWIMYDKEFVKSKGKLGRALPDEKFFNNQKILIVRTRNLSIKRRIVSTIDNDKKYNLNRLSNIISKDSNSLFGLLGVLNSNLYNWLFSKKYLDYEIKPVYIKKCPIPDINNKNLINSVELILNQTKELNEISNKFQRTIQRRFEIDKLPKKLQDWYLLTYNEFLKELSKKKVKLSLEEEGKWEDFFIQESKKILELKDSIDKTDKEIDTMVYKLYNLTSEEIEIIESSF